MSENDRHKTPTPGPWHRKGMMILDDDLNVVADVRQRPRWADEDFQNARLITAAPRLLSQLDEVHDLLVRLKATHGHLIRRELDRVEVECVHLSDMIAD